MLGIHLKYLQETFPARTALRPKEVCRALGIGPTLFYSLVRSGKLRVVKFGKVTAVPLPELAAWLERTAEEGRQA